MTANRPASCVEPNCTEYVECDGSHLCRRHLAERLASAHQPTCDLSLGVAGFCSCETTPPRPEMSEYERATRMASHLENLARKYHALSHRIAAGENHGELYAEFCKSMGNSARHVLRALFEEWV